MPDFLIGRVREVNRDARTIVLGHRRFRLREAPGPEIAVGARVRAMFETREGQFWITDCLADQEVRHDARPGGEP
jgi:hypothetical protein